MKLALTHTNRSGPLLAVLLPLLLLGLAALPVLGPEPLRDAVMTAFAPVCHQLPERSFALGGVPMALCQRCSGFVAGLALGALALVLAMGRGRAIPGRGEVAPAAAIGVLVVGALPMGLDWGLDVLGVWVNTAASRAASGAWLGGALGVLLAHALATPVQPAPRASDRTS